MAVLCRCGEELLISEVPENRILYCCNCGFECREWWPTKVKVLSLEDRIKMRDTSVSKLKPFERNKKKPAQAEKKMKKNTDRRDYVARRGSR